MPTNVAGQILNDEEFVANNELQAVMLAVANQLVLKNTATLSPVAVAANTTAEQSFGVNTPPGASDLISVEKPTAQAGLGIVGWRRIDATHVGITFVNATAGSLTPTASEAYKLFWLGYNA